MTKTRRSFTDEFKREAVKLVKQPGAKVTHIAGRAQKRMRRRLSARMPACSRRPSRTR